MNSWIDLTILIDENYKVFPGDNPIRFFDVKTVEKDMYHIRRIDTNMHVGTHLDAKKHVLQNGSSLEAIDVSRFIGVAKVIKPLIINQIIQTSSIALEINDADSILILNLNWSQYLNTEKFYNYPKFQKGIVDILKKYQVKVIGLDIPSPEYEKEELLQMHRNLLENDIYVIENLTNLNQLSKTVDFIGLPLKIKGMDGSMLRCVARNR